MSFQRTFSISERIDTTPERCGDAKCNVHYLINSNSRSMMDSISH